MKIFIDTGDPKALLELANNEKVAGFTTNPTLMRKAGISDYVAYAKSLLAEIRTKPISFEVFDDEFAEMERQAKLIAAWGKNVWVKIPITNTRGESSIPLIERLAKSGVQLNVTAVFTLDQVIGTAKVLAGGPSSIVSIFAGRIADSGRNPVPLMQAAGQICKAFDPRIELLWASSREALNIAEAEQAGCDIITVTPDLLAKMSNFGKDLHQFSLETVQLFRRDAVAAGYKL